MKVSRLLGSLFLGLSAAAGLANTYTVTSTADSGAGSLRQAILDANTNPGADTIVFNIVGSGVQTIAPTSVTAGHHGRRDDRRLHAARILAQHARRG